MAGVLLVLVLVGRGLFWFWAVMLQCNVIVQFRCSCFFNACILAEQVPDVHGQASGAFQGCITRADACPAAVSPEAGPLMVYVYPPSMGEYGPSSVPAVLV